MSDDNATPAPAPTSPPVPPRQAEPWQRVLGAILILIGVLLVGGAGLCTMVFIGSAGGSEMVGMVLMTGGPFILVGALLWWGGVALRRPK